MPTRARRPIVCHNPAKGVGITVGHLEGTNTPAAALFFTGIGRAVITDLSLLLELAEELEGAVNFLLAEGAGE